MVDRRHRHPAPDRPDLEIVGLPRDQMDEQALGAGSEIMHLLSGDMSPIATVWRMALGSAWKSS